MFPFPFCNAWAPHGDLHLWHPGCCADRCWCSMIVLLPMFRRLKALLLSLLLNDHFPCKTLFWGNIAHHIPHNINFYTHPHVQPSKSSPKRPDPIALVISPRTTPGCGTRITTIAATSGPTASPPPPASVATAWWSTATGRRWWQLGVRALGGEGYGGGF